MSNQAEVYDEFGRGQYQHGLDLINKLSLKPGDKVLDIGSGTGNLTIELARQINPDGVVWAVEPDSDRLVLARKHSGNDLAEIKWIHADFESFESPENLLFDAAFSNYVFHWMIEQKQAVQKVYDCLKEGGRFAFSCVFGMPPFFRALCDFVGKDGQQVVDDLHFTPRDQWLSYFEAAGFTVEYAESAPDYYFKDADDAMKWWEGTTHGLFAVSKLSDEQLAAIREKHQGPMHVYREETLQVIARK